MLLRDSMASSATRRFLASVVAFAAIAPSFAETVYEADTVVDYRPTVVTKSQSIPKSSVLLSASDPIAELRLGPLNLDPLLAEDEANAAFDKVLRIGVERKLRVGAAAGEWMDLPDGSSVWVLDIVAEEAAGLRVRFTNVDIPKWAELLVFSPDDPEQVSGPFSGRGQDDSGEIWAGSILQSRVRVEYHVPEGFDRPDELPFEIDGVQHYYRDPISLDKQAGNCHNDVTCFPDFATEARAVGRMLFSSGGSSGLCTGSLITNEAGEFTSLFITAKHCISTSTEATSLEVFWLYQTATCNGTPPNVNSVPRTNGSTLLSTGGGGADVTLLRLTGTIPNGLAYLGWSTNVPEGTQSVCIHHPAGDFKRISFGNRAPLTTPCQTAGTNPIRIAWTDGPTEQGSSGSGIFARDTRRLYGVLSCGPSSCGSETEDYYGSFAQAFPILQPFLGGGGTSPPSNDNCANAIAVGTNTTLQGTNTNATSDGASSCAMNRDTLDVWWSWVAPSAGTVTIDTVGSGFDTILAVFGACGGTEIACNDDIDVQSARTSRVQFTATAGTNYLIRVAGFDGAMGSVVLNIAPPGTGQAPSNDECANAANVTGARTQGSTTGATGGAMGECPGASDAWWRFTANTTGAATIDTIGSGFDTTLMVFSSCGGAALACDDDISSDNLTSQVQLNVTAGGQYLIRVAGFNGATGAVVLNIAGGGPSGNTNANTGTNQNVNSGGNNNTNSNNGNNGGGGLCPVAGGMLVSLSFAGLMFATRGRRRG